MVVTYLIMKLTLQAIVDECNRMAAEAESLERARALKARVAQLDVDYATGLIDEATYNKLGSEVLNDLEKLARPAEGSEP